MNSSILVINCGSSSLKFALINTQTQEAVLTGLAEKLGLSEGLISFKYNGEKSSHSLTEATHSAAMASIIEKLHAIDLFDTIKAVGHRVVHGGEHFKSSALIDETVVAEIEKCAKLAPLHNPAHLLGIRTSIAAFPGLPQVAVFDTAFHQSMPEHAYLYAVPKKLYRENSVRRYGFHGTSYRYVTEEAARVLGKPATELAMICAHLGNGASATAILHGKSVDTTMGLTPLEGLVMGTRSGDIDPGIFGYLASELKLDVNGVTDLLNKQSGLLGLSELSSDCRELEDAAQQGNVPAILALKIFAYRLAKHIAALTVSLGRLDAVMFTGGIGENSSYLRALVINQLGFLGLTVDGSANDKCIRGQAGFINQPGATPVLVINTNEELMIALDTASLAGLTA